MTSSEYPSEMITKWIKQAGLRYTPQREAILRFLANSDHHPSAEEIYDALHPAYPGLSLSTVYNSLNHFLSSGLIREIPFPNTGSRYDLHHEPHHHFRCLACGNLSDFKIQDTPQFIEDMINKGFQPESYYVEIKGICLNCSKQDTESVKD